MCVFDAGTGHMDVMFIAGFAPTPFVTPDADGIEHAYETSMYDVVHRQFCALPE